MPQFTIRAKRSVIVNMDTDGKASPRVLVKDRIYAEDDPVVLTFPDEFTATREVSIEQATAAPGERRK